MRLLLHGDEPSDRKAMWDYMSDAESEWTTIAHLEEHHDIDVWGAHLS